MANIEVQRSMDAVWRIESARLIAGLTRIVRDVGVAEELAQDALVTALDLLAKLHRNEEAIQEFDRAPALTRNETERGLLRRRAARVVDGSA